jgi:hypothetical protein
MDGEKAQRRLRERLRALTHLLDEYRVLGAQLRDGAGADELEAVLEAAQRRLQWMGHRVFRVRLEITVLDAEIAEAKALGPDADELVSGLVLFRRLHSDLLDALLRLIAQGEAELAALDPELPRLAAQAREKELQRRVVEDGGLDGAVRRVNLAARKGAALLVEAVDRIREEVHLVAPADRRAEDEVVRSLFRRKDG